MHKSLKRGVKHYTDNSIINELLYKSRRYKRKNSTTLNHFTNIGEVTEDVRVLEAYAGRHERMKECNNYIKIKEDKDGNIKVQQTNLCRDRFCVLCNKIKSSKRVKEMTNVLNKMYKDNYLYKNSGNVLSLITLTIKNCDLDELHQTINDIQAGYKKFYERKKVKDNIIAISKNVEITLNEKTRQAHPHIHLLTINKRKSITTKDIQLLWKESMKLDYIPQCDIVEAYETNEETGQKEDIHDFNIKAVREALKYSFKFKSLENLTTKEFFTLDQALKHKRLIAYSKLFKEYRKMLNYKDETEAEITNEDLEETVSEFGDNNQVKEMLFAWSGVKRDYERIL